jgi:ATP-independent RNA helicase DbpA
MTLKNTAPDALLPTSFANLALSPAALANWQQLGYSDMTPIQAASLPIALAGNDLIAQAQTGSGKTAAFGLALLGQAQPALVCRAGAGAVPHT